MGPVAFPRFWCDDVHAILLEVSSGPRGAAVQIFIGSSLGPVQRGPQQVPGGSYSREPAHVAAMRLRVWPAQGRAVPAAYSSGTSECGDSSSSRNLLQVPARGVSSCLDKE